MLMRPRLLLFLSLFVVATFSVTACGKESDSDAPQAGSPTAGAVTSPEPSPAADSAVTTGPAPAPQLTRSPEPAAVASPARPSEPALVPGPPAAASPPQQPEDAAVPGPVAIQATEPTPAETPVAPAVPTVIEGTGGEKPADAVVVTLAVPAVELPTVEVVKILTPSVVQIVTEVAGMGFSNNPVPQSGVGTGVILDIEGHILTNNHVVSV